LLKVLFKKREDFLSLTKIREKTGLNAETLKKQLERVKRTVRGQRIELKFTDAVLDRLADVGYVPELGARELKRKIQSEIETPLATELLSGHIAPGDFILVNYDSNSKKMSFTKEQSSAKRKPGKKSP
jgi:ATP-dependent Clp protease ATP-binding subunit ClpC